MITKINKKLNKKIYILLEFKNPDKTSLQIKGTFSNNFG